MRKKFLLSTLYNLLIFLSLIGIWVGYNNKQYSYMIAGIVGLPLFLILKVRVLKDVRNTLKP